MRVRLTGALLRGVPSDESAVREMGSWGMGSEAAPAVLAYAAGELARRAGRRLTLARWGEEGPLEEILDWLRNSGARVLVVARPFEKPPGPLGGTSRLGGLVERAVRPTVREVLDFIIEREAGRRGWDLTDGDRVALRSACGYEPLNLRYLLRSLPGPPEVPKERHALRAVRDLLNKESVSELGKVLLAAVAALYRAEVPAPEWLLFRIGREPATAEGMWRRL